VSYPRRCARCHTVAPIAEDGCMICVDTEDLSELAIIRNHALINRLVDIYPMIANAGHGPDLFVNALGLGDQADTAAVLRMCDLLIAGVGTTAEMIRTIHPDDDNPWGFEIRPEWRPAQVLAARLIIAGLNKDSSMVSDLVVSVVAEQDPMEALEALAEVLYWTVAAASTARRVARSRQGATS
jgi:hypothetical protein